MPWWWPFKRKEAARVEFEFRESLNQALITQDDLKAATEKLSESRRKRERVAEEPTPPEIPTRKAQ